MRLSSSAHARANARAALALAAATLLAGLLVVRHTLDVLREAFLLAQFLEPPEHLLSALGTAALDLNHSTCPFGAYDHLPGAQPGRAVYPNSPIAQGRRMNQRST